MLFDQKVTESLVIKLGTKAQLIISLGFEPGIFGFGVEVLIHCAYIL